jgi:hypothetical protein
VHELTWLGQREFGLLLIFVLSYRDKSRRRRGGNVGIRRFLPDFQVRWKEWGNSLFEFSHSFQRASFPPALFISMFSERSDAERTIDAACVYFPLLGSFFRSGQKI